MKNIFALSLLIVSVAVAQTKPATPTPTPTPPTTVNPARNDQIPTQAYNPDTSCNVTIAPGVVIKPDATNGLPSHPYFDSDGFFIFCW